MIGNNKWESEKVTFFGIILQKFDLGVNLLILNFKYWKILREKKEEMSLIAKSFFNALLSITWKRSNWTYNKNLLKIPWNQRTHRAHTYFFSNNVDLTKKPFFPH